jgi:ABC-type polysaccharide/polyol phosphate transport system ATPase subunit
MTGRENTRFACRIQGMAFNEMDPIIEFVQSFAELGHFFDMPVRVYSSGMRARLGFGITMAFDFDFYIIDELSAVGDATFRNKAAEVFREKRLKSGFVRASHSLSEMRAECTSGLVLHNAGLEYWPTIEGAIERYLSVNGIASASAAKGKSAGKDAAEGQKARRGAGRGSVGGSPAETGVKRAARRKARQAKRQVGKPAEGMTT